MEWNLTTNHAHSLLNIALLITISFVSLESVENAMFNRQMPIWVFANGRKYVRPYKKSKKYLIEQKSPQPPPPYSPRSKFYGKLGNILDVDYCRPHIEFYVCIRKIMFE